ncbi:hypothetical protein E4U41_004112 [Claviceps citrina]|nr:hypothetical protein E4U41_004112 [Claviceps citrina]
MFYDGTLQRGISTAVGQQKLVFCFVTNENDESETWEKEFLQDDTLRDVIAKRAIALRLTAGSEEAGYLSQIFPLPQTPTVVIMKHGELKEYIAAGTTKADFLCRVQNAFDVPHAPSPQPSASSTAVAQPPASASASDAAASPSSSGAAAARELELAAQRQRQAEKRNEAEAADKSAQEQAELLKKKKTMQQQSDERRRILKRIQDDKEARRQQAQERELQRLESRTRSGAPSALSPVADSGTPPLAKTSSSTKTAEHTSIQVRLLDGSTIRSRFKTASPVRHLRQWVDAARTDGSTPYVLKQLLTPQPNRPIDDTEEDKSLGEVGLSPSSTLILVPIPAYASAYGDSPSREGGILSRLISLLLGAVTWLLGVLGLHGGDGNGGSSSSSRNESSSTPPAGAGAVAVSARSKDGRVQGFENPNDRRRDHQLYNGNSLNFEPRPDDEDGKR